jgi:ABC-type branched-subunit amino acid transport system substrate-binding protein
VLLLADALKHTGGSAQGLKAALADGAPHAGVIGPFTMSPSGDVIRPTFITHVTRGRFVIQDSVGGLH